MKILIFLAITSLCFISCKGQENSDKIIIDNSLRDRIIEKTIIDLRKGDIFNVFTKGDTIVIELVDSKSNLNKYCNEVIFKEKNSISLEQTENKVFFGGKSKVYPNYRNNVYSCTIKGYCLNENDFIFLTSFTKGKVTKDYTYRYSSENDAIEEKVFEQEIIE